MAIIAAAFLAMMLAGCSSDDNGAAMEVEMPVEMPDEPMVDDDAMVDDGPPPYDPSQPGGTREDAEDRYAAQRIAQSVGSTVVEAARPALDRDNSGGANPTDGPYEGEIKEDVFGDRIRGGVSIDGISQARLGQDPMITLDIAGGSELGTATDSAGEAPAISGFEGVSLMKDGPGAITQMALVYSDIERSVRAWGDAYRYNTDAGGTDLGTTLTTEAQRTHLLIGPAPSSGTLADFDSKISWDHGLSTTTGVTTRSFMDTDTVTGSYDGVSGQFEFNGTVTITFDGTDVTFTAAQAEAVVFKADNPDVVIPDRDYLAFGVWTEIPDDPTNANPGRVRPFVHGNAGPLTADQVAVLTGDAKRGSG
jgi:hypothetical protein